MGKNGRTRRKKEKGTQKSTSLGCAIVLAGNWCCLWLDGSPAASAQNPPTYIYIYTYGGVLYTYVCVHRPEPRFQSNRTRPLVHHRNFSFRFLLFCFVFFFLFSFISHIYIYILYFCMYMFRSCRMIYILFSRRSFPLACRTSHCVYILSLCCLYYTREKKATK